jgi:hypothetical protein
MDVPVKVPDFARAYLTFRIDALKKAPTTVSHKPPTTLNNARLQIEARCRVTDRTTQSTTQYVRSVSCKTERVGVEGDIWLEPNADMCMTLSDDEYLDVKAWDTVNKGGTKFYPPSRGSQPDRQIGRIADAFDNIRIDLKLVEAEALTSTDEIIEATLAGELLVGQVEFSALDRYEVVLDFPIKTINVSPRDRHYQPDTGPIIFPDWSMASEFQPVIETLRWAFVAFNTPDWAEFIVQVPTPLNETVQVYHYSKPIRLNTRNTLFRLLG